MTKKLSNREKVPFACLAPTAANVALAGDFTTWELDPVPMKKNKDGWWKVTVNLAPGRYEYKFIVDGQWIEDPAAAECSPDPYGGANSVRVV
jgi:1,4-alpha-glucan branching enzyme